VRLSHSIKRLLTYLLTYLLMYLPSVCVFHARLLRDVDNDDDAEADPDNDIL